jgi:hypothetical protein
LEGGWDDERFVILEFETAEAAWAWYRSAEFPVQSLLPSSHCSAAQDAITVRFSVSPVAGMRTSTRHCHSFLRSPFAHDGTETIFSWHPADS